MRTLIGIVKSAKMNKTVVVVVESKKPHPVYKKIMKKTKKYKADVGKFEIKENDIVKIAESRPLSSDKRWTVIAKMGEKLMETNI